MNKKIGRIVDYNLNTQIPTFKLKFNCQFWDMKEKNTACIAGTTETSIKTNHKIHWIKANTNYVEYNEDDYY